MVGIVDCLRRAAGTALALLVAFAVGSGSLVAAQDAPAREEQPIEEQVADLLRNPGADRERLTAALIALGPTAIPASIDVLRDERVPALAGGETVSLAPEAKSAVNEALRRCRPADVVASLQVRVAASGAAEDRRIALELLGELGRVQDLDLLFQASTPPPDGEGFDTRIAMVAQRSLARIFERQPAAVEASARRLPSLHAEVAPVLARAIASSSSPASFELLAQSLGKDPGLDLVLLSNLAQAEGRFTSPQRRLALEKARAALASSDPMLARAAAALCGELYDSLAAPSLCDLLDSPDAQLAGAAHRSLKLLSCLGYSAQGWRWRQWLQAEEKWFQGQSELLLGELQASNDVLAAESLQALVQHPLYRETLAPAIAEVAGNGSPTVRAFACTVLGRLRWPGSVPKLRELSLAAWPEVARAASEALHSIEPALAAAK